MALFRCSSGGGSGSADGATLQEAPALQALNLSKTYNNLEVGKVYTFFVCYNGSRDCAVASVSGGTFTQKANATSSSMSYSLNWIVPTNTTITITMASASSGGVIKSLFKNGD